MAETSKVVEIRINYANGKVMGADGDDAETIWRSICNDVALTAIRAGAAYKYAGPSLKEIKNEGAAAPSLPSLDKDKDKFLPPVRDIARQAWINRTLRNASPESKDALTKVLDGYWRQAEDGNWPTTIPDAEEWTEAVLDALYALSSDKVSKEVERG